ncbi:O-methyltransferase [Aspergillus bombycis]|uniref:O-methyltransferase n=1 Tax=Aspergillus bombycis TaxID=109264 RepID=A0A1F7ZZ19_9EURO|nr:O-methyltransferase [Aspergillus bombycis]OGM44713.1 O-methyltransferase [Aspergillus bombycis]
MAGSSVSAILDEISSSSIAFNKNEAGSREGLIEHSRALIAALEIPSEFIQRTFWAEPAQSAIIRLAVDVKLFQHLQEAGDVGLTPEALAHSTGVDTVLLSRLARHLVAMNLLAFHNGAFQATRLSNDLAAENFQHSISFCYDAARPSFNTFPQYFEKTEYRSPTLGGTDGPFQEAHKTQLPFFEWLIATPPHLQHFDSFMSAYRAGKADWHDFYPVTERMIAGFDSSVSDVLLVDVGGGRGHDVATFAGHYTSHPGRIVLQDREPVIASPIKGARAYFLHSILHDWGDDDGIKILENLAPALVRGYSRVLLNEIVISEEKPTLAATSMDMMMLAHFAVRERTEAEWRSILAKAGLKVVNIYNYPGVAESLIEAELA